MVKNHAKLARKLGYYVVRRDHLYWFARKSRVPYAVGPFRTEAQAGKAAISHFWDAAHKEQPSLWSLN